MSQHLRTIGAAAIGALVVAVAALSVRPGPVAGAPSDTSTDPVHSITVTATGTIDAVPDVAHVSLGVSLSRPTVKAARADAATAMQAIIDSIKALGIDQKDIATTGLNLSPQYSSGSPTRVVGYGISEQISVTVRDLDKTGDVVDTATAKGATDVNGIWFEVSDPDKAQNDARTAAVESARKSAQALASAAGVSLGKVIVITDSTPTWRPYPMPYAMGGAAASDAAKTPVEPGTQGVAETVTVVFAID